MYQKYHKKFITTAHGPDGNRDKKQKQEAFLKFFHWQQFDFWKILRPRPIKPAALDRPSHLQSVPQKHTVTMNLKDTKYDVIVLSQSSFQTFNKSTALA